MTASDRYCKSEDLLVDDVATGFTWERVRYVNLAADEIDGALGGVYKLPLGPTPFTKHVELILKNVNIKIATGRMILAKSGVRKDEQLQAYGEYLLKQGLGELDAIKNGTTDLIGVEKVAVHAAGTGAGIINYDDASAVDSYYEWAGQGENIGFGGIWAPGTR